MNARRFRCLFIPTEPLPEDFRLNWDEALLVDQLAFNGAREVPAGERERFTRLEQEAVVRVDHGPTLRWVPYINFDAALGRVRVA
jgi:hypothetical protein